MGCFSRIKEAKHGLTGLQTSRPRSSKENLEVSMVRIINEYPDVFPDDLPGLPP